MASLSPNLSIQGGDREGLTSEGRVTDHRSTQLMFALISSDSTFVHNFPDDSARIYLSK